jgi:integrase
MATVVKQPSCRYWIAAFRDSRGRQHRRTTRETNRRRAQAVADQYERAAKGQGHPQRVRQILSEFLHEHFGGGEELPFSSVEEYCGRWLAARKTETVALTYLRYNGTISKFLDFLGPQAQRGLDEITRTQISAFRDHLLSKSAAGTVNIDLKVIRRIFRAARTDGYLLQDPAESVKAVKNRDASERRPFTLEELRAVLAVANDEWRSLIMFGLYTGQRLSDLAALTWNSIDLERDEIRLTTRKTGKALLIPMAAPLHKHLLGLPAADNPKAPVHPNAFEILGTQEGRVGTLSNQFSELMVAAGLRQPYQNRGTGRSGKRTRSELTFHSLRHTAVSLLKDAGIPDAVVISKAAQALPEL